MKILILNEKQEDFIRKAIIDKIENYRLQKYENKDFKEMIKKFDIRIKNI